ncbi:MAG: CDP-glycerol glycerophosphotransferase family protein [Candidatus Saccharibacteria bacterium]|nr:MAG: CDP-glycerol glycerophosphotransferase family protein [Candidatus Saccharibacteria bacterium]
MPVYNVESFLSEAVESIINQSMDFERHCEIIFINDGSPDNSEKICLEYKKRFPNNIRYIKQENAGPAAARNRGIELAEGKYISMVDSDDRISRNTLEEVSSFFESHYDEIDLVAIKQVFFEARTGEHPLNYKFTSDRIIDLSKNYDEIQMSITSSFIKADILKEYMFEESVGRYAEDSHLMGKILLKNPKFGVVVRPTYFYRKRLDQASSLDTTIKDKFWYLETPVRAWKSLFDIAAKQEGKIPEYIQFMAMYDLQWRFKQATQSVLSPEEVSRYKKLLFSLVAAIDDRVIVAQRQIDVSHKLYILSKKHKTKIINKAEERQGKVFYEGVKIYDRVSDARTVVVDMIEERPDVLEVEGYVQGAVFGGNDLKVIVDGKECKIIKVPRIHKRTYFLDEVIFEPYGFKVVIPKRAGLAYACVEGDENYRLPLVFERFSHLNQMAKMSYWACDGVIVKRFYNYLTITSRTRMRRIAAELQYAVVLARRLKLGVVREFMINWKRSNTFSYGIKNGVDLKTAIMELRWVLIPLKSVVRNLFSLAMRAAYFALRPFYRRPIWIISDRIMAADDSGEILFRYIASRPDVNARIYFAISKKSSEYAALTKYGKVVDYGGVYYKILFLLSDKIISSEAADYVINPFRGYVGDFVDLFRFDFVFLQHGIIKDDISSWLNKYSKNIKLFVTSTKPEYESIINGDYGYGSDIVKLTGLPRYDLLSSHPKKKLILMPTWRDNLAGPIDPITGDRLYNPGFIKSEYYKFYQDLINDQRLLAVFKEYGFTGELYLHPSFKRQIKDFKGNGLFTIKEMPHDYPKAKREGSLLVTDYSSVAFDFAYLKKPVIYTHFDEDSFYKTHTSKVGYFSYEKNGFGPVAYEYNKTVRLITETIEDDCTMPKKYQKRVESFFYKFDRDNSKRVYETIISMKENQLSEGDK